MNTHDIRLMSIVGVLIVLSAPAFAKPPHRRSRHSAIVGLRAEVRRLRAENRRLREQIGRAMQMPALQSEAEKDEEEYIIKIEMALHPKYGLQLIGR